MNKKYYLMLGGTFEDYESHQIEERIIRTSITNTCNDNSLRIRINII